MSGADRCDEIVRLIDEALEECEVSPRNPQPPVVVRTPAPRGVF
jgi:hypothetical protein